MKDRKELQHVMDSISGESPEVVIECHCICHGNDDVKHCMPCCSTCGYCGRNIKYGMETHMRDHSHFIMED
jgi:hypothetical protein